MKLALLNLLRVVMSLTHSLPVFLFTLLNLCYCTFSWSIAKGKRFLLSYSRYINPGKTYPGFIRLTLISFLFLFITIKLEAEGTKQLEPLTPNGANGSCELVLFAGGMTANGYRIPFATVGCDTNYRLNVHISNPATEVIYFGFKQQTNQPLYYRWRAPDGSVVPGYALAPQPAVGNPGFINTWNEAVAGPLTMNAGGYNPLIITPTLPGEYYIEFAQDALGNTNNMNGTLIEFIDISVYEGNTVKEGRLWSKAWQFYDRISTSPKTNFYIYANDGIVTKLNINNWEGGDYIFYCNEWGVVKTGNWYTNRQSLATWPGDLPDYKIFLNDPDNNVYPTGSFGKICDAQTISKCDGSVEFQVKVDKPGKIDMTIDIFPYGSNTGEDVKIDADVVGSPGCNTWETIQWDGKDGNGNLLQNGATPKVNMNYLNGLTHLPIYDIESNNRGIQVDIVRPAPTGDPRLNIYWDDSQVTGNTNFTGCIYNPLSNPSGCHTWPNGDKVMFNSWWFYLSDTANRSPIVSRLPATPSSPNTSTGQTSFCAGQTNVAVTVPVIQFADSLIWTLPDGTTKTTLSNTIFLDFPTAASGGNLSVHGKNALCAGNESPLLNLTVKPIPDVSASPYAPVVCSGVTTDIILSSTVPGTTFTWTASAPSSILGFSNGSGNSIIQSLSNVSNAPHVVTYVISPVAGGCTGTPLSVFVTVQPSNTINSVPLAQTICSGDTATINLSATVPGTGFSWTVSGGAGISGYSNGTGNIISQQLINVSSSPANAVYLVTGVLNGCTTNTSTYTVTVNNLPKQYSLFGGGSFCAPGAGVPIGLSGSEMNINYQLLRGGIPDGSVVAGTGGPIGFGNRTITSAYTILAKNATTGCVNMMSGSVNVIMNLPPTAYLVTGGGSYIIGGIGMPVGLANSEIGVRYQLYCNNTAIGAPLSGTGASISFGNQTQAGVYTIIATNISTGCTSQMLVPNSGPVTIIILPLPVQYSFSGGGTICEGDPGFNVFLNGSETGINYQLYHNGIPSGPAVGGTGSPLTWGPIDISGTYTLRGTNPSTTATRMMTGNAVITVNPLPKIYKIDPIGQQCPGTIVRLNGSESGVIYYLLLDGYTVDSIPGNGVVGFLDFGPRTMSGTYSVFAVNQATGCKAMMDNYTYISIAPEVFNVLPAGILCPGQTIRLSGSELNVSYQLRWNTTYDLGNPVPGTGSQINMGVAGQPGVYTVIGINDTTHCVTYMNDSATLYPDPVLFTVIPDGEACEGDEILLNGSQSGVDYILFLDNAIHGDTIHGTGSVINFGAQITAGNYTIMAEIQNSHCMTQMNGTAVFRDAPIKYNLTPNGIMCIGNSVGISGSQVGTTYQLLFNGNISMGSPIAGTGNPLSFGTQTSVGTYTVNAVNSSTGCNSLMTGKADLVPLPIVYQVGPSGHQCAGNNIILDGSEVNFNYALILNGSVNIDTIPGTGAALDFGPQITAGTYTVVAFSTSTFCLTNMSGSSVIDARPILYNLSPAGVACSGDALGLDYSEVGVNYQLRRDKTINVGAIVAGTGSAISFGIQTVPGVYTVEAAGSNGCHAIMIDSVQVHPMPVLFTILPAGSHCPGTSIKLNGSETGVNYVLVRDGIFSIDTLAGTGGTLDFGTPMIAGTYTVTAYSTVALCQSGMNGSSIILLSPTQFNITPAGISCLGSTIGLENSEIGVNYQLRRNGISNVGIPQEGTGTAISFGVINLPGTYTIIATNALTGCGSSMNGDVVIRPLPLIYTILPQGMQCAGISVKLNGSQVGTDYVLIRDNTFNTDTVSGTGMAIDFGPQYVSGTYTIEAIGGATTCQAFMNGSTQIMDLPAVFNITPAGISCATANVGLDGSEIGVSYTIYKNGIITGTPVSGTGNAISFGTQSLNGTYIVRAVNDISGCNSLMADSIILEPLPVVFNTTPSGSHCAGTSIGLNGSELNFNYVLVLNGAINLDTIPGTGNALDFGPQTSGGNYTIVAYNVISACTRIMNSNSVVVADPINFNMTPGGISCAGSTIGIENSETGISYQLFLNGGIDIGSPVAGTGSAISFGVQYQSGIYTVRATNSIGCFITLSSKVEANPLPAIFKLIPSGTQCKGTALGLDGSELNARYILVHNGNEMVDTINGTGDMITFGPQMTSGNYSVIAFFEETNCQSAMNGTTLILTQSSPTIYAITPAGVSCGSADIGLDNSEIGIFYQLRLNGSVNIGTPITGTGTPISFGMQTLEGIYTVIATNSNGCTNTALYNVTIGQIPIADFNYTGGNCDSLVKFEDLSYGTNIDRWIWNFGDGKSKIIDAPENPNLNHNYFYPGIYDATLIILNQTGCSDTITKAIRRTPCIEAAFKVSDPVVCQKRSMKFTEQSTCQAPIASWTWYFGDNTSARYITPQPFIEHTYAVSGNYNVTMVVATNMVGGMVTDTAKSQISVKPAAKAAYKWQDVCVGNNTTFDNQSQDNNTTIKSYLWNFGDPGSLTDTTSSKQAEYKYDTQGIYDVKLVVTNTLGCTDTIINKVNIFEGPIADFTWNNSCEARPVFFTDNSQPTSSDIVEWNWKFSKSDEILERSNERNFNYSFAHAGTYEADMMVTDQNGCATTVKKQVTIETNPVAAFDIIDNYENKQGQIMLTNGTIGGTNNFWDFGNGKTSYGSNPVVTYDEEGQYTIQLITWSDQNCSDTLSMTYNLMYKGLFVPNAFYPGHLDPEVAVFKPKGTNLKLYHIEIYDSWGNLLWKSDELDSNGSPAEAWDGTYKGVLLQQDVYVWKIIAQFNDGEVWDGHSTGETENMPQSGSGTITLLR